MDSVDLKYYRQINKLNKTNNKDVFISDMISDYNEARENVIYRFNIIVDSTDGKDVYVNNSPTPIRGVVNLAKRQTANSDSQEIMQAYPNEINSGDYLRFKMNDTDNLNDYIITSPIDKKNGYDEGVFVFCNQILKWKDKDNIIHQYPCVSQNDSYGSKLLNTNEIISLDSSKTKIILQDNDITRTIEKDMRFLFSNSKEDIFKAVDINKSINKGIITIICNKDLYRNEDDLVNNLAFNNYSHIDIPIIPPTPTTYSIDGNDSVKVKVNQTYSINPNISCTWSVDDNTIANIVSQSGGSCVINPILVDEFFVLTCNDISGNKLCEKIVNIIR